MSLNWSDSDSSSSSRPSTAQELQQYWDQVNNITGGNLGTWAQTGTGGVAYTPIAEGDIRTADYQRLEPSQVQALGGLGATRKNEATKARQRALEEVTADPSLSVAQRLRARQLTDDDYNARADAIAQETEAAITGLMSEEALRDWQADQANATAINNISAEERQRAYQALLDNAELSQRDLEILAQIFFGGQGNHSQAQSDSDSFGGGIV